MADPLQSSLTILRAAAERHDSVLVSYSGGKDSLIVMDLCVRTFTTVSAFFMAFLPGLRYNAEVMARFSARWPDVPIREYPHWLTRNLLYWAPWSDPSYRMDDLPRWDLKDVYAAARAETGIRLIAFGGKRNDGVWRNRTMTAKLRHDDALIAPLVEWTKYDVVAYCARQALPVMTSDGRNASGVDLSERSLRWLKVEYPDDFEKVCEVFPYAEASLYRADWYPDHC